MARPAPHRLQLDNYPFQTIIPTRWADLDLLGHINNVSMAGVFEEGRLQFNRSFAFDRIGHSIRWLIAAVTINYVKEAHYPDDIILASGIGAIGTRSWVIESAAFQNGECVATCDSTIVFTNENGPLAIPDDLRTKFETVKIQTSLG